MMKLNLFALGVIAAFASAAVSQASVVTYFDRTTWTAAAGTVITTNFNGLVSDTDATYLPGPDTFDGFTFTPPSVDNSAAWLIGPQYPTFPPEVYDWGTGTILGFGFQGTSLDVAFPEPVLAFGLDFGIFQTGAPGGVLVYGGILQVTFSDGTVAYGSAEKEKAWAFRGFISDTPFTSVTLSGGETTLLDNVARSAATTAPEPGTFALMGLAFTGGWVLLKRFR